MKISDLEQEIPEPNPEYRPFVRWWWFGSNLTSDEIKKEMLMMKDKWIGGVELQSIYGAMNGSKHLPDTVVKWRSDEWLDLVDTACQTGAEHNLTVDMTFGNGWPFGGPYITPKYASSRLKGKRKIIMGRRKRDVRLKRLYKDPDRINAVLASRISLLRWSDRELINVSDQINDEVLAWKPRKGLWMLYSFCTVQTKQKVKRAAPGGEGWVLDHLDHEAFDIHAEALGSKLQEKFGADLGKKFGAFFCDSWEVYRENWTRNFLQKFEKEKGYELADYLPYLRLEKLLARYVAKQDCQSIIYDYRQFHSHLILTEFFKHFADYCHSVGVKCRVQPYSAPTDLLKAYGYLDILEIEGFGSHGIGTMYYGKFDPRLASSAAHIYGKKYVSCESFTWLGEHFSVSLEDLKREADQIILHGINRIIYHGYPYSPEKAGNPGTVFYASIMANHNNTWWPYFDILNKYIARNSLLSRETVNCADYLVYIPLHDEWSGKRSHVKHLRKALKENGFLTNFDYINDDRLQVGASVKNNEIHVGTGRYRLLILWETEYLPRNTLNAIVELVRNGARLLVVGEKPNRIPGFIAERENQADISDDVKQLERESGKGKLLHLNSLDDFSDLMREHGFIPDFQAKCLSEDDVQLKYLHQRAEDCDLYFIVNEHEFEVSSEILLRACGRPYVLNTMKNTMTGPQAISYTAERTGTDDFIRINIELDPLESRWIVVTRNQSTKLSDETRQLSILDERRLENGWKVEFPEDDNCFPEVKRPRVMIENSMLFDWTDHNDTKYFSGTATYSTRFSIDEQILARSQKIILSLGEVREIAEVSVNGEIVGVEWYGKRSLDIKEHVKPGSNSLVVRVTNLLLNQVIGYDRSGLKWKPDYYFVSKYYLPFKPKIMKLLPSGLLGPVKMIFMEENKSQREVH